MQDKRSIRRFGIVGGLGALGAADVFFKLVKAMPGGSGQEQADLIFEQHPFREDARPGDRSASHNGRKLYVFDMIRQFEARGVDAVILPCFLSHTFIDELQAEVRLPIVNILDALRNHLQRRHPGARRLGILTSDLVREEGLFERPFPAPEWDLRYPHPALQRHCVMGAIYGADGIKAGQLQGSAVERLAEACRDLLAQGAELIVPGFAEIPIVIDTLCERGIPILDTNQIYAHHAVADHALPEARPFKIGIVGGVGPAATVDFVSKIVRNTAARRDQEHVKLVVEQNPQIPDRTEHLVGDGPDPTVALYSTCKKLEAADADLIAIPCNTAHAFVERIQPYLSIPVVNMLDETVGHILRNFGEDALVGLLATSGTLESGVYRDAAEKAGLRLLVPDDEHQALVMNAVYGPKGAKAGFTEGECVDELQRALASLAERGAEVIILGCTELPLLLAADQTYAVQGRTVAVLDPTEILAKRCVALSGRN
ncbi:MAG TPA: amino acid racemase [Aromatoleum sp.]|uniref:aspartate/glutamate racemase family protein n=1 Tax=Aromatoleum sp. TaxID=2307007 RepID=UPI002B45A7E7|nr:amino acid racemase [Aromatoleum sp.]HJV28232.1 amino acid racemase [Aromatoleum sp.]